MANILEISLVLVLNCINAEVPNVFTVYNLLPEQCRIIYSYSVDKCIDLTAVSLQCPECVEDIGYITEDLLEDRCRL